MGARLCLRVASGQDSVDVIGTDAASLLPRQFPGRALVSFGPGELITAQIATTALGLAGALTAVAVPSLHGFATTAQGIALGGNAVAFGVNWLDYFNERSRSYMPLGDVKKQK